MIDNDNYGVQYEDSNLGASAAAADQQISISGASESLSRQRQSAEPYSFRYNVQADGGQSMHEESGDSSGKVTGFYMLNGDDGRMRRVDYFADETGFHAQIRSNEIGTRTSSSGDAQYNVEMPSSGQLEQANSTAEEYEYQEHLHELARIKPSARSQEKWTDQSKASKARMNKIEESSIMNAISSVLTNDKPISEENKSEIANKELKVENQEPQKQDRLASTLMNVSKPKVAIATETSAQRQTSNSIPTIGREQTVETVSKAPAWKIFNMDAQRAKTNQASAQRPNQQMVAQMDQGFVRASNEPREPINIIPTISTMIMQGDDSQFLEQDQMEIITDEPKTNLEATTIIPELPEVPSSTASVFTTEEPSSTTELTKVVTARPSTTTKRPVIEIRTSTTQQPTTSTTTTTTTTTNRPIETSSQKLYPPGDRARNPVPMTTPNFSVKKPTPSGTKRSQSKPKPSPMMMLVQYITTTKPSTLAPVLSSSTQNPLIEQVVTDKSEVDIKPTTSTEPIFVPTTSSVQEPSISITDAPRIPEIDMTKLVKHEQPISTSTQSIPVVQVSTKRPMSKTKISNGKKAKFWRSNLNLSQTTNNNSTNTESKERERRNLPLKLVQVESFGQRLARRSPRP